VALSIPAGWKPHAVGADAPLGAHLPVEGKLAATGVPRVCGQKGTARAPPPDSAGCAKAGRGGRALVLNGCDAIHLGTTRWSASSGRHPQCQGIVLGHEMAKDC